MPAAAARALWSAGTQAAPADSPSRGVKANCLLYRAESESLRPLASRAIDECDARPPSRRANGFQPARSLGCCLTVISFVDYGVKYLSFALVCNAFNIKCWVLGEKLYVVL